MVYKESKEVIDGIPQTLTKFYDRKVVDREFNRMTRTENVYVWTVGGFCFLSLAGMLGIMVLGAREIETLKPLKTASPAPTKIQERLYAEPGVLGVESTPTIDCRWEANC